MSLRRQALTPDDEGQLIVRTMVVQCSAGLRTTSPTEGWGRLVAAAGGVIIVRTPHGAWSAPGCNAVWVPAGVRCDLEMCTATALRMLYVRLARQRSLPSACRAVTVSPLLREVIARIAAQSALDRRIAWHRALERLLVHEICDGAQAPHEVVWPTDPRLARVASILQAGPADRRHLRAICRGQGVSARTVQRLFPLQTGLTFEAWRMRVRFLHAIRLLADGGKVCAVALECGYESPSAFVAAFRRFAGVTPGEFCRR